METIENKSGIYMIISPSAKVYIGQAKNIKKRLTAYKNGRCKNQHKIIASLLKYGYENHFVTVNEYCPIEQLNERERYWQEQYEVLGIYGLNCQLVNTSELKQVHSYETRQKIGEHKKGKSFVEMYGVEKADEIRKQISKGSKGRVVSDETKKKMSEWQKGKEKKPLTAEHKKNIGIGVKGKRVYHPLSEETKRKIAEKSKGNTRRLGKAHSDETKQKIREARLSQTDLACQYCGKITNLVNHIRWHSDNCKVKRTA